jgi:hypothetical protein
MQCHKHTLLLLQGLGSGRWSRSRTGASFRAASQTQLGGTQHAQQADPRTRATLAKVESDLDTAVRERKEDEAAAEKAANETLAALRCARTAHGPFAGDSGSNGFANSRSSVSSVHMVVHDKLQFKDSDITRCAAVTTDASTNSTDTDTDTAAAASVGSAIGLLCLRSTC